MSASLTIRSRNPADEAAHREAQAILARYTPTGGWICNEPPVVTLRGDESRSASKYLFLIPQVWLEPADGLVVDPDDPEAIERRSAFETLTLLAGVRALAEHRRDRFRVGFDDWLGAMSADGPDAGLARWMRLLEAGAFVDAATGGAPFGTPMRSWIEPWT